MTFYSYRVENVAAISISELILVVGETKFSLSDPKVSAEIGNSLGPSGLI